MEDFIEFAINAIQKEVEGLQLLSQNLPKEFTAAALALSSNKGRLVVSGIGKSGYIGQKISATLASTGTRAFYIHPAEASHGDLGMIGEDDIVMLLSNSGETKELLDIISYCKRFSIPIIGITMNIDSILAKNSNYLLNIPKADEACLLNAPTTSTTMMMALGDALAVAIHRKKGFTHEDFRIFHPGGKIGASMLKVKDLMHIGKAMPVVDYDDLMDKAILEMTSKGFGCTIVVDKDMKIHGIITDGDLRRHMNPNFVMENVKNIMTPNPIEISSEILVVEALAIMSKKNVTSLIVATEGRLEGILHIHDLLRAGVK